MDANVSTRFPCTSSVRAAYVFTFMLLDLRTALALCFLLLALRVNVTVNFALAKAPPLRGPRLALDGAVAAALSRAYYGILHWLLCRFL